MLLLANATACSALLNPSPQLPRMREGNESGKHTRPGSARRMLYRMLFDKLLTLTAQLAQKTPA
jgi:hypothetical protein